MKSFGHNRLVKFDDGTIARVLYSPAKARTKDQLGYGFGPDKDKRLIVSLDTGDLITVRPERTQRSLAINARDLWHYLNRCQCNRNQLERARARKERKAARLAALRQQRAEKRLFQS